MEAIVWSVEEELLYLFGGNVMFDKQFLDNRQQPDELINSDAHGENILPDNISICAFWSTEPNDAKDVFS
jgi:hypothetical protein